MLSEMQDGDLVLIYGAVDDLTDQNLRAQALGFLEVSIESCTDRERMSDEAYRNKVDAGFEHRWTHGIKVRRAWRIRNRVAIKAIAPEAYEGRNRFVRTTRAILLTQAERARALTHTVREVDVFGEPPIADRSDRFEQFSDILKLSRSIKPSFGDRSSQYDDGENELYLMLLTGAAKLLIDKSAVCTGSALAKVGRSNDPVRRLGELNCGFPITAFFKWKLEMRQAFPDGATADARETELKAIFDAEFKSQGGEFFTGDRAKIISAFQSFCVQHLPRISGAPARAKGA